MASAALERGDHVVGMTGNRLADLGGSPERLSVFALGVTRSEDVHFVVAKAWHVPGQIVA